MTVRRVVPNIPCQDMQRSREFYGLLGMEEVMDQGWIMTMGSLEHPQAQVSFFTEELTGPVIPDVSVEVSDVDATYQVVRAAGAEVVYPLTDEEWGVRRFFVRDPNGRVVNVLSHRR